MGGLDLFVGSAAETDLLLFQERKCCDGDLIYLAWKAADARPRDELVKALHAVFLTNEFDVYRLHGFATTGT